MASGDYRDLLTPDILRSVSGLALIARIAVEGYITGKNRSLRVGPGMEFSQYRGYQAGDDPRLLDWKMLARSDRYYIKQSEQESLIQVKFIVDASASMLHREGAITKADFARVLVASLAYLAYKQGDAVGLFGLNDDRLTSVYPRSGARQYHRLLLELLQMPLAGTWPSPEAALKRIPERGSRELLFFLTDMYEQQGELSRFIRELKSPRNEVVVFHIMGKSEMELDYGRPVTLQDLETGATVQVDADRARTAYRERLKERLGSIREALLGQRIDYKLFRMDEPLEEALQHYLKQRTRLI